MKYTSIIYRGILLLMVTTLLASPFATVEASRGKDRGNHYGWYKQIEKRADRPGQLPFLAGYDIATLEAYIKRLQALLVILNEQSTPDTEVSATTRSAINVSDDSATLRGQLTIDTADGEAYFEYGTKSQDLNKKTTTVTITKDQSFEQSIDNLADNTRYYFRLVIETEDGVKDYGSILSFTTTDSDYQGTLPDVITSSALNISTSSATIRGKVEMNDFENGRVFFVYGTDMTMIDEADEYSTFTSITEDGVKLQKIEVGTNLDSFGSYSTTVTELATSTKHYYRLAVEYLNEDDNKTTEFGSIRSFTTTP